MRINDQFRWIVLPLVILLFTGLLACDLLSLVGGGPTPFPVETDSVEGTGAIAGLLWHDWCASPREDQALPPSPPPGCIYREALNNYRADGLPDIGEPGVEGIQVLLGEGECPSSGLMTATTDGDGVYMFAGLNEGTYCVGIDPQEGTNASILPPGIWTYPVVTMTDEATMVTVVLSDGEIKSDVFFGWDYELIPPFEPSATEIPTETPLFTSIPSLTETPTPTITPSLTVTPSLTPEVTLADTDPKSGLGDPAWRDTLTDSDNWPLYEDGHVRFEIEDDELTMTAFNADYWNGWMLTWPVITDFYLEANATSGECAGLDAYGILARVSRTDQGHKGYLFGFSCDGHFSLRTWDGESYTMLTEWTSSTHIISGANQTNRIGIWAEGDRLKLYANGNLLAEVTDSVYEKGMFGVFVGAVETAGFQVTVEEIAYWNLP
jgi:hypothetical protein